MIYVARRLAENGQHKIRCRSPQRLMCCWSRDNATTLFPGVWYAEEQRSPGRRCVVDCPCRFIKRVVYPALLLLSSVLFVADVVVVVIVAAVARVCSLVPHILGGGRQSREHLALLKNNAENAWYLHPIHALTIFYLCSPQAVKYSLAAKSEIVGQAMLTTRSKEGVRIHISITRDWETKLQVETCWEKSLLNGGKKIEHHGRIDVTRSKYYRK